MFDRTQIDPRVQKQLFRKIDSINRRELGGDGSPFFVGNALDVSTKNPASEHLFRGCFAKVSIAVPNMKKDEKGKSTLVHQPISLSSYMNGQEDDEILGAKDNAKNTPLTFSQGVNEDEKNRFRGHSGITKISVAQQKYYTYKYTIDWTCPDPVYFEEVFEPNFLRMGAYAAIEFGWGIEDSEIKDVEPLSIEEMRRFLTPDPTDPNNSGGVALRERNLKTSGNYFCGVGTVIKFKWSINSDGTYSGNMEVMTPGASALSETTQGTSNSSDSIPVMKFNNTFELQALSNKILKNLSKYDIKEEEREAIRKAANSANDVSNNLQVNSTTFNVAMRNLDKVADYFLDDKFGSEATSKTNYNDGKDAYALPGISINKGRGKVTYDYHDGLIRTSVPVETSIDNALLLQTVYRVPDFLNKRYFMSWGWFEDNMLNTFFKLKTGSQVIQSFKSETKIIDRYVGGGKFMDRTPIYKTFDNKCVSSKHLYSLGLDNTILPGKHHPTLADGFSKVKDPYLREFIPVFYKDEQRVDLDRIRMIYKVIDDLFPPFLQGIDKNRNYERGLEKVENEDGGSELKEVEYSNVGSIRNMVFPIEMFQKHFQDTTSTRQGIRNFWADVNNQYGGYWGFQIGESTTTPGQVGVFDSYYSPKKYNSETKATSVDITEGMFTFSVYSKDSIVKSFDANLDLSAEAATLARYGHFSKPQSGTTKIDGKKELGIEAWNILNRSIDEEEVARKEDLRRFRELNNSNNTYKNVSYEGEDLQESFLDKIKNLDEDDKKVLETLESSRVQFINGVGCYDKKGNFSSYFKGVMLHLINFSDMKGSGSNIETSQAILPIEVSLTLDGIGGLSVGNLFKLDYLPKVYREFCYFMITKVEHSIGTSGWETTIGSVMIADLPSVWQKSGKRLNSGLEDYQSLFDVTNIPTDLELLRAFLQQESITFNELDDLNDADAILKDAIDRTNELIIGAGFFNTRIAAGIPWNRNWIKRKYKNYVKYVNKYEIFLDTFERSDEIKPILERQRELENDCEIILNQFDDTLFPVGGSGGGGAG